jgi:hypothetical protein
LDFNERISGEIKKDGRKFLADEKKKTLGYRRAEYLVKTKKTLEQYLVETYEILTDISQRRVEIPGYPILACLQHLHKQDLGILLHIAAYTPGEHASVVPYLRGVSSGDVKTTPPPKDCEFMDGDIMILVAGNNVLLCSSNLHEKKAESYMREILDSAGTDEKASKFGLIRRANIDTLKFIKNQGVRAINLGVTMFEASFDHMERTLISRKIGGSVMDQIKAVLFQDRDLAEIDEAENLSANIVLKYDGHKNRKGSKALGRKKIEELTTKMFEDGDDGFSIELLSGETVRGSDVSLKKNVTLQKHGKSVYCVDAWRALEAYYYELKDGGLLEL